MSLLGDLLDRSIVLSFDKTGFARHARGFGPHDLDVDRSGHVALVTGASSGLGVEIARGLGERGATVHMLCRDVAKGERVRASVGRPLATAHVDAIDLSDFASIRRFAHELAPPRIDVLVHNAGVLPAQRQETEDGLELTAATNLVGPFLLTHLLWDRLAPDARLVHVSSGGMYSERLDVETLLDPPSPFDGVKAYARTKRAQVVLAELLDARSGRRVSSMHPGWADTPGVESSLPRFHWLTRPILRTPAQGADTILWLAVADAAQAPAGRFYFDRAPQPTHLRAATRETEADRSELWRRLCELVGADPERDFR